MIKDLYQEIKIQLYERAISPLLGSFVISWCLWNYKFLLILLTSDDLALKTAHINKYVFDGPEEIVIFGFLLPMATTLFFVYVYPYPARWIFEHTRRQQVRLKEIQQKIDDDAPLTTEEARKIRANIRAIERQHDEENTQNHATIEALREELGKAETKLDEANRLYQQKSESMALGASEKSEILDTIKPEKPKINNSQTDLAKISINLPNVQKAKTITIMENILTILSKDSMFETILIEALGMTRSVSIYSLDILLEYKYIKKSMDEYFITPKGNKYVVENSLYDLKKL